MRILITGAGGGVGRALAAALQDRHEVLAYDHARLDVADAAAVAEAVAACRPDAVVNPAAIAEVDVCERDPARANAVNGHAAGYLAEAAARAGALCIQFSTDYVFDGAKGVPYSEDDPTCPINAYGAAKRLGETLALAANPRTYVVRTAWVMNPGKPSFLAYMVAAAQQHRVRVTRQTSSPTGVTDLIAALTTLLTDQPAYGIYHLVNHGCCSRREMAEEIYRLLDVEVAIDEVEVADISPTPRPVFSALTADAWARAGYPPFRPWQEAMAEALAR